MAVASRTWPACTMSKALPGSPGWILRLVRAAAGATMAGLSQRAIHYARAQPLDVPPLMLKHARDWHIVDATTIKLPDELMAEYPGAGRYAALKVHKRLSVGTGTIYQYHFSPARDHDAPHLVLDESWRGLGLLVDLGYASLKFISDCKTYGIRFVMRLKESWKPKVGYVARGKFKIRSFPGRTWMRCCGRSPFVGWASS